MKKQSFLGYNFRKGDFLIFGIILAVAIVTAIGFYRSPFSATSVKIYVDSQEYATYVVSEGAKKTVTVQTDFGYNQITMQSGSVQITESDCHNHDCTQMGKISHAGDMLICLPHKLVVVLEGGDPVDAVSY